MLINYSRECGVNISVGLLLKKYIFTHPGEEIKQYIKDNLPAGRCGGIEITKTDNFAKLEGLIAETRDMLITDQLGKNLVDFEAEIDHEPMAYTSYTRGYLDAIASFAEDVCFFMDKEDLLISDSYISLKSKNVDVEIFRKSGRIYNNKRDIAFHLPKEIVVETIKKGGIDAFNVYCGTKGRFLDNVLMSQSWKKYTVKTSGISIPDIPSYGVDDNYKKGKLILLEDGFCHIEDIEDSNKRIKIGEVAEIIFSGVDMDTLSGVDYAAKQIIFSEQKRSLAGDLYLFVWKVRGE
jgi:hypothetical protein